MNYKNIFKNILIIFGAILVIAGIVGILLAITILAYEVHWFLGSLIGCFCAIVIGLFLMNVLDENSR